MDKIIVRKKVLQKGYPGSALIFLTQGKRYSDEKKLVKDYGLQKIMKSLFDEDIESNCFSDTSLFESYSDILTQEKKECYRENENFIELYKIDEDFAVQLDKNIYLYHIIQKRDSYMNIMPWYYSDSKLYIGDTWWMQNSEIIEDIQKLSIIEFMKKYKGY